MPPLLTFPRPFISWVTVEAFPPAVMVEVGIEWFQHILQPKRSAQSLTDICLLQHLHCSGHTECLTLPLSHLVVSIHFVLLTGACPFLTLVWLVPSQPWLIHYCVHFLLSHLGRQSFCSVLLCYSHPLWLAFKLFGFQKQTLFLSIWSVYLCVCMCSL